MMADDEDIPANFPVDDLPEDEPVRKRRLLFYTLEQKKNIVHVISPSCWLSSMLCYKKNKKA
jgi:hypothetical protein